MGVGPDGPATCPTCSQLMGFSQGKQAHSWPPGFLTTMCYWTIPAVSIHVARILHAELNLKLALPASFSTGTIPARSHSTARNGGDNLCMRLTFEMEWIRVRRAASACGSGLGWVILGGLHRCADSAGSIDICLGRHACGTMSRGRWPR